MFNLSPAPGPTGAALCGLRPVCFLMPLVLAGHAAVQSQTVTDISDPQRVVVTATRFASPLASVAAGVQIITAQQIAESGAATVGEALMRILGIPGRLDFYGGGNYGLDLRGFGETADSNQVIIVDGLRLSEPDLSRAWLAGIPIESVVRIEVLRGGSAVLYGEGATAGAIVITTRGQEPVDSKPGPQGRLSAGVGSLASRDVSASGRWTFDGLRLDASAKHSESDNHRPNARSRLDATEISLGGLRGGWSWGLRHAADRTDARMPGALPYADFLRDPFSALPIHADDFARIDQRRTQVHARGQVAGWQLAAEMGWRRRDVQSYTTSAWGGSAYDYGVSARDLNLRLDRRWDAAGSPHRTQWGLERREWNRTDSFGGSARSETRGAFVRQETGLGEQTTLSIGLRVDLLDRTTSYSRAQGTRARSWETGLSHRINDSLVAWGRAGTSYRSPSADELTSAGSPSPDLRSQRSRDAEAGLRWSHAGRAVDVRVYRSALVDEIAYDPGVPGAFGFGANVNLDPTRRQGLEGELTLPLSRAWRLQPHGAWRQAEFRSGPRTGLNVPLAATRSLGMRISGDLGAGHRVSGGLTWTGSSFVDLGNSCRVPSYSNADVRYAFRWRDVELSLGLVNLADRRYFTLAFDCAAGQPASVYPEPGRTFNARATVSF